VVAVAGVVFAGTADARFAGGLACLLDDVAAHLAAG
jgi:hypothetical protein